MVVILGDRNEYNRTEFSELRISLVVMFGSGIYLSSGGRSLLYN